MGAGGDKVRDDIEYWNDDAGDGVAEDHKVEEEVLAGEVAARVSGGRRGRARIALNTKESVSKRRGNFQNEKSKW